MDVNDDDKQEEKKEISYSFICGPPNIDEDWICPICHKIFRNPVKVNDKFTFCNMCIKQWWTICDQNGKERTNPMTNLAIQNSSEIQHDSKLLKEIKHFFEEVAKKMNEQPQYIKSRCLPKQSAKDAQKFFEQHLSHLKPEYETYARFTEYIAETWYRLYYQLSYSNSDDNLQDVMNNLKQQSYQALDNTWANAEEKFENAQNQQQRIQIIEEVQQEVNFLQRLCKGIIALIKKLWNGVKISVKYIRYSVNMLFAWISGLWG